MKVREKIGVMREWRRKVKGENCLTDEVQREKMMGEDREWREGERDKVYTARYWRGELEGKEVDRNGKGTRGMNERRKRKERGRE